MPFGSIFSKLDYIDLVTADEKHIHIKNTLLSRIGFKLIGLPHIGLRLRASKIMKNVKKDKSVSILDAGCGTGVYSFSLSNKVKSITAVDISPDKIKNAKNINIFGNITFSKGDITNLPFPDKSFDVIICSDVIEHIKDDDRAISELSRVLKNGGQILITVPSDSETNKKNYKKYGHERPGYNKKMMESLSEKNGLILLKSEGYSSNLTERLSDINYKFANNNVILAILFYPLYLSSLLADKLFKDFSGVFFKLRKI